MIRWVLNAIVILLLIRLIVRFLFGLLQGLGEPADGRRARGRSPGRRGEVPTATLVRDPACGTYIPRDGAITAIVRGETRYYCSEACRAKDADAARFQPAGRTAHG